MITDADPHDVRRNHDTVPVPSTRDTEGTHTW